MYLPKTWPSHPIPSLLSDATVYKTVSLSPVIPDNFNPKAKMTMPAVQVSFADTLSQPTAMCSLGSSCPTHRVSHILQDILFP